MAAKPAFDGKRLERLHKLFARRVKLVKTWKERDALKDGTLAEKFGVSVATIRKYWGKYQDEHGASPLPSGRKHGKSKGKDKPASRKRTRKE